MAYTVKKIAELSGVSIRTLRWYDEVGLLKPAYYGDNGYRYYEEEQLLLLQQILFYRELGFPLGEIREIVLSSDFDKVQALQSHRTSLKKSLVRTKDLIKTVDKTLLHIGGIQPMKEKDMYKGFLEFPYGSIGVRGDSETDAEKIVLQSVKKNHSGNWEKADFEKHVEKAHAILKELTALMEMDPSADAVQEIIKKHHAYTEEFHAATKEVYKALAELYRKHPAYRKQLDPFHPELADFMARAMEVFAENNLS